MNYSGLKRRGWRKKRGLNEAQKKRRLRFLGSEDKSHKAITHPARETASDALYFTQSTHTPTAAGF